MAVGEENEWRWAKKMNGVGAKNKNADRAKTRLGQGEKP